MRNRKKPNADHFEVLFYSFYLFESETTYNTNYANIKFNSTAIASIDEWSVAARGCPNIILSIHLSLV